MDQTSLPREEQCRSLRVFVGSNCTYRMLGNEYGAKIAAVHETSVLLRDSHKQFTVDPARIVSIW